MYAVILAVAPDENSSKKTSAIMDAMPVPISRQTLYRRLNELCLGGRICRGTGNNSEIWWAAPAEKEEPTCE